MSDKNGATNETTEGAATETATQETKPKGKIFTQEEFAQLGKPVVALIKQQMGLDPEANGVEVDGTGFIVYMQVQTEGDHTGGAVILAGGPAIAMQLVDHILEHFKCKSLDDLKIKAAIQQARESGKSEALLGALLGIAGGPNRGGFNGMGGMGKILFGGAGVPDLEEIFKGLGDMDKELDELKKARAEELGCDGDCKNCSPEDRQRLHEAAEARQAAAESGDKPEGEATDDTVNKEPQPTQAGVTETGG